MHTNKFVMQERKKEKKKKKKQINARALNKIFRVWLIFSTLKKKKKRISFCFNERLPHHLLTK